VTTHQPVLRRGVIWGEGHFSRGNPLFMRANTINLNTTIQCVQLHSCVKLITYICCFAWRVSNCGRNYQQWILLHGAVGYNTDLLLHAPYSQGTGSEERYSGWERDTDWRPPHTHTHTHGQPEHSDIDFSMLPAVGDSSLGHASRHIPIRTALEGVGFRG